MSDRPNISSAKAEPGSSITTDDEEAAASSFSKPKLSKRQITVLDAADPAGVEQTDANLSSISFLLCVFDNIVGPRIVHHWLLDPRQVERIDEQLLKYIAVHTLNGELYQDKLHSHLKFRLYLIQEINRAIFSVFFDASTISTAASTNAVSHYSSKVLLLNFKCIS